MSSLLDQVGQGFHPGLPGELYYPRRLGEANKGALDVVSRSLCHYRDWVNDDQADLEERKTFIFGRALHCALFEADRFESAWVVSPDFGNLQATANRLKRERWLDRNSDKEQINAKDFDTIRWMMESARRHVDAGPILQGCTETESTCVYRDEATSLPCKARFDGLNREHRIGVDAKGSVDASYEAFARSIAKYRYHVQHAHYCEGARVCGEPLDHFLFIAIEKARPFAVGVWRINSVTEQRGYDLRSRDMEALARGMKENRWPSYNNDRVGEIAIPTYALID